MKYEPKILINRTGKRVEFMCGGETHVFEVGEKRPMDGLPAHHALNTVNTGLEEYIEDKRPDYSETKWVDLIKLVKGKGYKVGMKRDEVIALLENGHSV